MPKNREQLASEIGVSVTTLWRKIKVSGVQIPKGPIFPRTEALIRSLFDLPEGEYAHNVKKDE